MQSAQLDFFLKSKKLIFVLVIAGLLISAGGYIFINHGETRIATINVDRQEPFAMGESRIIPIMIDTVEDTMNAAEIYINFDPQFVRVETVSQEGSIFKIWINNQPSFSNDNGTITFAGGLPNPGFKGVGQIGAVTLTLLQKKDAKLIFTDKTRMLKNDGEGNFVPLRLEPILLSAK